MVAGFVANIVVGAGVVKEIVLCFVETRGLVVDSGMVVAMFAELVGWIVGVGVVNPPGDTTLTVGEMCEAV